MMKPRLITSLAGTLLALAASAGCPQPAAMAPANPPVSAGGPALPAAATSTADGGRASGEADTTVAGDGAAATRAASGASAATPSTGTASGCGRELALATGEVICLEDLVAALLQQQRDNDRDGLPNANDRDIDGDGIPNGYDPDVDGDGVLNADDGDVDDDGVPNEADVDIDGDFLRNRWDFDMDGDLLYNPFDPDADGDGVRRRPILAPLDSCGPVEQFNDPDACPGPETDDQPDGPATGPRESAEHDAGPRGGDEGRNVDLPADTRAAAAALLAALELPVPPELRPARPVADPDAAGTPPPAEPTTTEEEEFERWLLDLVGDDGLAAEFQALDPAQGRGEVLDDARATVEELLAELPPVPANDPRPGLEPQAVAELADRRQAIARLADGAPGALDEALDVTRRLNAARRVMRTSLPQLVDAAEAIRDARSDADELAAGRDAVALSDTTLASGLPVDEVAPAAPAAVATTTIVDEALEAVWQVVVDNVSAFRDEDGLVPFGLPSTTLAVQRIAGLLREPELASVNTSIANILTAADSRNLRDPLAIIDQLAEDPGADLGDGVSPDEAQRAADALASP